MKGNSRRRVVVTGVGAITTFGKGYQPLWEALISGKSGIRRIQRFPVDNLPCQVGAEVLDFSPDPYIPLRQARQMDRFCQFGVWAALESIHDAKLDMAKEDPYRVGILAGSGIGGLEHYQSEANTLFQRGSRWVTPFFIPKVIINLVSGWLSILQGIRGYSNSVVTACSTSLTAIGEAFKFIQANIADIFICGGSEAAITLMGLAGFSNMKALSTNYNGTPEKASRPFDLKRDGFVMGDGAGMLVLEELTHAEKRGARIYAEILGYSLTSDAYHITAPDPSGAGAAQAIKLCLQDAGLAPSEIEYINAHGTSTPYNDKTETLAIKQVFGERAYHIPISSTKSMHGHLLGAAGGVESVACILALHFGILPPTINYEHPDPDCDLDYVPNESRKKDIRIAMNNSFAFGGHNAILIFKKYEDTHK